MYKPDDFVFCVFSYNRYLFLKNLIVSLQLFYPKNVVVIYDDGSNDIDLLNYYEELKQNPKFNIITTEKSTKNFKHGGLYDIMNSALKQGYIKNYKFAFFIQDDLQFLRHKDLSEWCKSTFKKWNNAVMISPVFLQKIYLPRINKFIEEKESDFLFKNYGVADIGIIHLERARKIGLTFDHKGEQYNGNKYFDLGHQLVLSSSPCLAWVPWAYSFKNKRKIGRFLYNKVSPQIKYLSKADTLKLEQNKTIPFLEDFTSLNNRWIPKPYVFLNLSLINTITLYLKYWSYLMTNIFVHERN